MKMPNKINV
ncbi:rhs element Vgr family protein, partial [Vibrio paracholerae HE-16]